MLMRKNNDPCGDLLTVPQAAAKLNLGEQSVRRIAREAGALIRIGRLDRVNWSKCLQYVEEAYSVGEGE